MSSPLVLELLFDDRNIEEMTVHGVTPEQAEQVLDNGPRIGRNRRERAATHLMIGFDNGGACVAIPIEPAWEPGLWRPVTAWYCKPAEWGLAP